MAKINTVIFDIGGVLVGYDWHKHLMKLNGDNEELVESLKKILFKSGIWQELDRGVLEIGEIIDLFHKEGPDYKKEIDRFFETVTEALWQFDFTKDLITDLKNRGYRVLFLSNWSQYIMDECSAQLDFIPLMDGGVFSCDVKMIKPNHDIYEEIIRRYQLTPSECVFLDDTLVNCQAAIECGLNAIQVVDPYASATALDTLLADSNI